MIALIVAVGKENVIGYKGKMPWGHLPLDMARFKALTTGYPIVMGSKTMDSIGRALPNRRIIVLTRDPRKFASYGNRIMVVQDVGPIFELAKETCVYIAGGADVYRQFMPIADIAYITRIDALFEGDTFFPTFSTPEWRNMNSVTEFDAGYRVNFELWARGYHPTPVVSLTTSNQKFELVTGGSF